MSSLWRCPLNEARKSAVSSATPAEALCRELWLQGGAATVEGSEVGLALLRCRRAMGATCSQ